MEGKDILKLAEEFRYFEFEFRFKDECNGFQNVRRFSQLELCDIRHSDKVIVLTGEEYQK